MTDIAPDHFQLKKNVPTLRAGDRVRVHQKIREGSKDRVQIFEGLVIKTRGGSGISGSFTVRRISLGVGVEKTFPLHLPSIIKIEKIKSARTRRAKLYYVRGLVGKKARRLKGEKDDAKVWEDVIVEEVKKDPEQEAIEGDSEDTSADMEKSEKTNKKAYGDKDPKNPEQKLAENKDTSENKKTAEKEAKDKPPKK